MNFIVLVLFAFPSFANAADCDKEGAREHFQSGDKAFRLGDFGRAEGEFRRSYELCPVPLLLYNLAQAYRAGADPRQALFFYKQFLSASDSGTEQRDVAQRRVVELDDLLAKQALTQSSPPSGTVAPDSRVAPSVAPAAQERIEFRPWFKNSAGWTVLATGVVLGAVGGGLAGSAPGLSSSAGSAGSLARYNAQLDEAHSFNVAGWTLVGVGAAAVVVGAIVLAIPRRHRLMVARAQ